MKTLKRMISGILAAVMVAASASFVSADQITFTDTSGHWAWDRGYIPYLVEKGVLNGYKQNDGTYMFKPEDKVTRAEFIKMLDETFGLTETANIKNKYNDVPESEWFYSYFAKAVEQGYILNYGLSANPNGELSREEATSLLVRYLALPEDQKVATTTFSDYNKINAKYQNDVLKAAKAEVINGYEESDGTYTFRPQNTLTRAEALTILYRAAGAIFTSDTSAAEAKAYEKNAVVKNGGVTLSNQKLNGRVIVGEGADYGTIAFYRSEITDTLYIRGGANIVFDAAKVKTVVVDSKDIINLTIQQGTTIENLIINEKTNVTIGDGTTVTNMTVNMNADNTVVSGKGTVTKAVIYGDDFSSSMIPVEYEIGNGITATFASKSYTGTSTTAQAFASQPVVSVESNYVCLTLTAVAAGTVRYYFTDSKTCPTADEFETLYNRADYGTSFEVKANKATTQVTYQQSKVKDYDYVVLMLKTSDKVYQPVIIPNEVAEGTGFATNPQLKSTKVEFTAQAAGTVYYMYSEKGDETDAAKFIAAYSEQSKELKGEITTLTGSVTVKENYANNNPYMVFMFKSATGLYYTPVVVALGDTGFFFEPEFNSEGDIVSVSGINGTLYYYYTDKAEVPAANKFSTLWADALYADSEKNIVAGRQLTVAVPSTLPSKYTHVVIALRTTDGEYMTPVVLKITKALTGHGFTVLPEVAAVEMITFKAAKSGVLYYYYSNESKAPDATTFNTVYKATNARYSGEVEVTAGVNKTIGYDDAKAEVYPYMVLMLEDNDGKFYQPVVVKLVKEKETGFTTAPYVDKNATVYFKAAKDCMVYWYYTKSASDVSAEDFYSDWLDAQYYDFITVNGGVVKNFNYNEKVVKTYPYLVIASTVNGTTFADPVIIDLTNSETIVDETKIGFKVTSVTQNEIVIKPLKDGELFYYETGSATIPAKDKFDAGFIQSEIAFCGSVTLDTDAEEDEIVIERVSPYRYVLLQLEYRDGSNKVLYEVVQVDMKEFEVNTAESISSSTSGTGSNQYGIVIENVDYTSKKLTVLPKFTGTLAVSVGTEDLSWELPGTSITVTKDQRIEVAYPGGITEYQGKPLYIYLRLKGSDGTVYKVTDGIQIIDLS